MVAMPNPDDWSQYHWESDALTEVLKYGVSQGISYARNEDGYFLFHNGTEITTVTMTSCREDPLQAARSLLRAILDDTE